MPATPTGLRACWCSTSSCSTSCTCRTCRPTSRRRRQTLQPGTGSDHPLATDKVKVHYTGWTTDGKMFDSSIPKGVPAFFRLNQVIAGWREGIPLMVEGETRRFWIPKDLAYRGAPGKPEGMLVFDVKLVKITKS